MGQLEYATTDAGRDHVVDIPKIVLGQVIPPGDQFTEVRYPGGLTLRVAELTAQDIAAIRAAKPRITGDLHDLSMADTTIFLSKAGAFWAREDNRLRQQALVIAQETTGLAASVLDRDHRAIAHYIEHRAYTYDQFAAELGNEWAMAQWELVQSSRVKAYPRGLVSHCLVGNIPLAGLFSLVRGLTTRNMNLAKVATRDPATPVLFASMFAELDPEHPLTRGLTVGYWGHASPVGDKALALSDAACLWGSDDAIRNLRPLIPVGKPIQEFGPKRSFAFIDMDAVDDLDRVAGRLATEVTFYDQEACLSPQRLFVKGDFSCLKTELVKYMRVATRRAPKTSKNPDSLAAASFARLEAQVLGWPTTSTEDWAIIEVEDPGDIVEHPLGRTLYVHPVQDFDEAVHYLDEDTQTLAIYPFSLVDTHGEKWARRGVSRIVELGMSRNPRKGFAHDGLKPLQAFVRFVSIEAPLNEHYKYTDRPAESIEDFLFLRNG